MVQVLLRLEEGPGLAVPEALVGVARPAELGVGAVLHDGTLLQHHDAVEGGHGGEAVGDHDACAAAYEALEHVLRGRLALAVEGRRRLAEDEDRTVGQYRAGDARTCASHGRPRRVAPTMVSSPAGEEVYELPSVAVNFLECHGKQVGFTVHLPAKTRMRLTESSSFAHGISRKAWAYVSFQTLRPSAQADRFFPSCLIFLRM